MKRIIKKAGKQLAELSKESVKDTAKSVANIPGSSVKHAAGIQQKESPIVEVMTKEDGKSKDISADEEKKILGKTKQKVDAIEQEMKRHREEREQKYQERLKEQFSKEKEVVEPGKPILPPSSPSRGKPPKRGTKSPEMVRKKH